MEDSRIVIPMNRDLTLFDCLLTVNDRDYAMNVAIPHYPSLYGASFNVEWSHKELLERPCTAALDGHASLDDFLDAVVASIKATGSGAVAEAAPASTTADYSRLLADLDAIGWANLQAVNSDFTEVRLRPPADATGRRRGLLAVKLDAGAAPEVSAELPEKFTCAWTPETTLKEVYDRFCRTSEQLAEFWNVMDELDADCWILEPETPCGGDDYRKLAVSNNVSLKVEVDPRSPRTFPQLTWLGSEAAVTVLRDRLADSIDSWDPVQSVRTNLERLLELTLPRREDRPEAQGDGGGCGFDGGEPTCCICYSSRLDGQVPSKTCDNERCGQSFHTFCLYEWLRSLVGSRKLGNKVFGVCPYCETAISCKPPDA